MGERELAAFASPTIAEAVRGVPGVYLSDDRSYVTFGMRGLGRLGSYGNRILVTYDGQPMNDDWIGSSYVGYDGLTDLGDVQRIEVVRGPGSVLYGTNALSGVINVVSRRTAPSRAFLPASPPIRAASRARVCAATSSSARTQGPGRPSRSGAATAGSSTSPSSSAAPVPRTASPATWMASRPAPSAAAPTGNSCRCSGLPIPTKSTCRPPSSSTLFGDPRTKQTDRRSYVELRAEPHLSNNVTLLSRLHWNHYTFRGEYARAPEDGGLEVDTYRGSWLGHRSSAWSSIRSHRCA